MKIQFALFIRGINISGKNRVSMAELKKALESAGFEGVKTFLNSGNVIAAGEDKTEDDVRFLVETLLEERFGVSVPVCVFRAEELRERLAHAPDWWGTEEKETYHNLIFILSKETPEEIRKLLGDPSEGLEKVFLYRDVIFWSFDRKRYAKCSWWKKTAQVPAADRLTIRTVGTVRKVTAAADKEWGIE